MNPQKIGVLVESLGHSQLTQTLRRAALARPALDVQLYYERLVPCPWEGFPCSRMHVAHAGGFDGPVVATSYSTAATLTGLVLPKKKIFLCWDLEWLYWPGKEFGQLAGVYGHQGLLLLARSPDHQKVLANAFNREVGLVDENALECFFDWTVGGA